MTDKERKAKAVREWYAKNIDERREFNRNRSRYNPVYIISNRYSNLKSRATGTTERSSTGLGYLSQEEYWRWVDRTWDDFINIYIDWLRSGCKRKLSPSIDRIDSSIGYIPENMQWLTVQENAQKY